MRHSRTMLPVAIMIHVGGWHRGDKANSNIVGAKMRNFVGAGYIYATINYRLSPMRQGDNGVTHRIHLQDCAAAFTWLDKNIADKPLST